MPDDIDVMKPWMVKAISARVIAEIVDEAARSRLTVGHLIERIWDEHKGRDIPEPVRDVTPDLTSLLHAAADFAAVDSLPREVRALINGMARRARGLPSPGQIPAIQESVPHQNGEAT